MGHQKFLISYALAGPHLHYVILYPEGPSVKTLLLDHDPLSLSRTEHCIQRTFNMYRYINSLYHHRLLTGNYLAPYTLYTRELGVTLYFHHDRLTKRCPPIPTQHNPISTAFSTLPANVIPNAIRCRAHTEISDLVLTLTPLCSPSHPHHEREYQALARDILRCLEALHAHDYCHRDIRLPNILVPPEGEYPKPTQFILTDFELAGRPGDDVPWQHDSQAPEVKASHKATKASDIYQLGLIIQSCSSSSESFTMFHDALLQENPDARPSASEALSFEWVQCVM
eukprot:gnl/Trimastix_PCT/4008.p1 GENE.gnl/Trimastix_PCT/4008~~gnl/Trimastix_PCT/4008.p1  ORF type:complete len:283 (-),score=22.66 gnl/Trimastix_PCT/4008:41-889(-)